MVKKSLQTLVPLFLAASLLGSCGGNGNNPGSPTDTQGPSISSIQGPEDVTVDELVEYSIDPVDPSGIDSNSYEWDWGADGSIEGTETAFSYQPTASGSFQIKVSVADTLGNRSEAYKDVTVSEDPTDTQGPTIDSIQGPANVYAHELAEYSIDPTDPSGVDSDSYEWDWGADGSIESTDATFSYAPTTPGTYQVKVSVADTVGNRSEADMDVTVIEPAFNIEYIVYDASGEEGAGLYSAEQNGVSDTLAQKMIDATGYSLPDSTAIEFNISSDSDSDGTSDLDEILANYAGLSSTEKDAVNPNPTEYQPFTTSDTNQDQYTHLIKIKREG